MDNWDPIIAYQVATGRHREDIARGAAAQRRAAALPHPARARLATLLAALARRLDPAPRITTAGADLAPPATT